MPYDGGNCKSIYDEIRMFLALGLTGNEFKVMMAYLVEKDEASREVRGKSQDELRTVAGLGKSVFSETVSGLVRRGFLTVRRHRQAPSTTYVSTPENPDILETRNSGNQDLRKTRIKMSGKPGLRCPGNPDIPKENGSSNGSIVDSSAGASARTENETDRLHREAYERGLAIKSGRVAKSARAAATVVGELHDGCDIALLGAELKIRGEAAAMLSAAYPGLDLAELADRACPELRRVGRPTYDDAMAVLRKWARILISKPTAKTADVLPFKLDPTTVRYAKPRLDDEVAHA